MTTEANLENINSIRKDRDARKALALEGLDVNEAAFEDDGFELDMTCNVLGMTVVARIEYDKEWDRGTRESGIEPHWEIEARGFVELYVSFGEATIAKDIPHDCGLANAILEAAQEWLDGRYETKGEDEG